MLTVDDYAKIRLAHRDKMSIREIARRFRHSRRKVREILANPQPKPYTRTKARPAPMLGSFHAVIDGVLADDENAPPKQRHTAMQVFRRLRDEYGYAGGYDQVRRYVGKHRRDHRETFIPLAHDPCQRLECDFGHIHIDFPDGRRLVPVMVAARPDSGTALTELRPGPANARPAALFGDTRSTAGGVGPRTGAAQLAIARIIHAVAASPGNAARAHGWSTTLRACLAAFGRAYAGACSASRRDLSAPQ